MVYGKALIGLLIGIFVGWHYSRGMNVVAELEKSTRTIAKENGSSAKAK